jgi:hypothetical protein
MKLSHICLLLIGTLTVLPIAESRTAPHGTRTFFSPDKHYRLETKPDTAGSQPQLNGSTYSGVLSRQDNYGSYATVWSARLTNVFGPSQALVTNTGRYVVTIGDSLPAAEENCLAIYGADGTLIRRWSLDRLLQETHTVRPPKFDQEARHIRYSDGADPSRPFIADPHIEESTDRLSLRLRTKKKASLDNTKPRNWLDAYEDKEVIIQLTTGRIM